ncbi:MAG TPA: hypothetical protein GXZ40_03955 [Bacteroidales bacterium]|jgi:hypothetical protein|nr:hypothetical protein [Bacteroidales bacterium]
MKTRFLFRTILAIVVLIFAVLVYRSIMRPERFRAVYELRSKEIQLRLSAIRSAQTVYKNEFKVFASDIDSLVDFVENGKVVIIKNIGEIPDKMTEKEAFEKGLLRKEEILIPAKDRILELDPTVKLEDFQYIPFTDKQKKFEIQVGNLESQTYKIMVYRIDVPLDDILVNMERSVQPENVNVFQRFYNYLLYSGLEDEDQYRVQYKPIWLGSLTEASITGSWE